MDQLDRGWSPLDGQTNAPQLQQSEPQQQQPYKPGGPSVFDGGTGEWYVFVDLQGNCTVWNVTAVRPEDLQAQRGGGSYTGFWFNESDAEAARAVICPPPGLPPSTPQPQPQPQPRPQPTPNPMPQPQPQPQQTCPVQPDIPMCPPPDVVPSPIEPKHADCSFLKGVLPNWDDLKTCDKLSTQEENQANVDPQDLSVIFGLRDTDYKETTPTWLIRAVGAVDIIPNVLEIALVAIPILGMPANAAVREVARRVEGKAADKIAGVLRDILEGLGSLIACQAVGGGCNPAMLTAPYAVLQIMSLLEKIPGVDFTVIRPRFLYWANYTCPSVLPDQNAIDAMRRTKEITPEQWQCLTRALGNLPVMADTAYRASQERLNDQDLTMALRRGLVDQDYFNEEMVKLGYRDEGYRGLKFLLSEYIPTQADLIPFMVRDVFDPAIVSKYRLADEFEDKFQGKAKEWAEANGINADVMRYFWMAHWQMPSLTQVYEMLWRNRPGDVPEDAAVTIKDVEEMIKINDVTPFWQKRLLQIAYLPLTNTEAKMAYSIGALSKDGFRKSLLDNGKDPKFVDTIVNAYEQEAIHKGVTSHAANMYRKGGLDHQGTLQALAKYGAPPELGERVMTALDQWIEEESRAACVAALHKRFELGDLPLDQLQAALINVGTGIEQANRLVKLWQCELGAKGKQLRALELCPLMEKGLITAEDALQRLVRMGYTATDAALKVAKCKMDITDKEAKKAIAAAKEQERKERQALRDQQALEKQRANAARAREKQAEQRAAKAAKTAEAEATKASKLASAVAALTVRGKRKLASLISKIAKKVSLDQSEVADTIIPLVDKSMLNDGLSFADALAVLGDMNNAVTKQDREALGERYQDALGGFKKASGVEQSGQ